MASRNNGETEEKAIKHGGTTINAANWGLLLFLSLIWGGSFFFVEVALTELPPFTIVFGRVLIGAVFLNAMVMATGRKMPGSGRLWRQFFVLGILNNFIPFSLIVWGQTQISGGLAAILNAATPFWAVVLAHFLTSDEKLRAHRLAGVVVGIGGVVFIVGPGALTGQSGTVWGQLAVVGATVSYALAGIYGKRFREVPFLVTATGQITATTILMAPIVVIFERPWLSPPSLWVTWAALAGLGIISTAIAYIIFFRLLASIGTTNLLLVTLLIPVSAMGLGFLFLNEVIRPEQLIGLLVIGIGLVIIDGRLLPRS